MLHTPIRPSEDNRAGNDLFSIISQLVRIYLKFKTNKSSQMDLLPKQLATRHSQNSLKIQPNRNLSARRFSDFLIGGGWINDANCCNLPNVITFGIKFPCSLSASLWTFHNIRIRDYYINFYWLVVRCAERHDYVYVNLNAHESRIAFPCCKL